ncbi:glycoside hydrolase family 16 protein [Plicaturopsis crispa FD-325 SS-3]|nr:glycoside hydrolase family 16 protein [Plicaturopsis crispa FD-325 SS-3]
MKFTAATGALCLISAAGTALGATYSRSDNVVGDGFNTFFNYDNIPDPTSGRVTYVDKATAQIGNLTYASDTTFILRADDTTTLAATDPGRNSVRLKSTKQYSTHVIVVNLRHMPEGCGTWPAVWEFGDAWPADGELDIIEGVNNQANDQSTLHTNPGCTIPASGVQQTGTTLNTDCDANASGNPGCGVKAASTNSFGPNFNTAGGGIYAAERTTDFIKVWFWSAADNNAPADASAGGTSVNTDNWGEPDALFPNTSCDIGTMFGPNNIVINLTFCGAWAGSTYGTTDGCPGTCVDYVNANPGAFTNAYFDFASINVYT